ncbi:MAG TPA: phosphodiester glycosidase family protein [Terrimicrobiaceae bacterium]
MRLRLTFLLFVAATCHVWADRTLENWTELGALDGGSVAWQADIRSDTRNIRVMGISFPSKNCVFRVIDNSLSNRRSLSSALAESGAMAGSNGGYFSRDFRPLGLTVCNGEIIQPFERAKLLSGVLAVRKGRIELVRSSNFKTGSDLQDALQAGPWLVERDAPVAGLDNVRTARRTVVANDGQGRWALIAISSVTLAEAANVLCLKGMAGTLKITNALNLDGGSSTALRADSNGRTLIDITSFGPVRNYLAIIARQH